MQRSTKWKKATLGFRIYKIWQILKRFARTFRSAQILKLADIHQTKKKDNDENDLTNFP